MITLTAHEKMTEEEIDMVIFQSHGKEAKALVQLLAERDAAVERADELGQDKDRWFRMAELHCQTIDRLQCAMRAAMRLLDQSEPCPEAAFSELLLALNPTLQSAKNKAAIDAARGE